MGALLEQSGDTVLVKICGLRRVADIEAAQAAGADLIGLVFAPSRRRVSIEDAGALLDAVANHPPAVGVFVDALVSTVERVAGILGLHYAQLSGHETSENAARLSIPYWKVVHMEDGLSADALLHIMSQYRGAAAFLLDSPSAQGGGSGRVSNWSVAAEVVRRADRPVLLAGGLNAENVAEGLATTGVRGVDVSSGVERDGWKEAALIHQFVRAARATRPLSMEATHDGSGVASSIAVTGEA